MEQKAPGETAPAQVDELAEELAEMNRDWLDREVRIAGIAIRPLDIRAWLSLDTCRNRVFAGDPECRLSDLCQFIYHTSAERQAPGEIAKVVAEKALLPGEAAGMFEVAEAVIKAAFVQAPSGSTGKKRGASPPCSSIASSLVDMLASEYGWTISECMSVPLAQVWQLMRDRSIRQGGDRARAAIITPAQARRYKRILAAMRKRREAAAGVDPASPGKQ